MSESQKTDMLSLLNEAWSADQSAQPEPVAPETDTPEQSDTDQSAAAPEVNAAEAVDSSNAEAVPAKPKDIEDIFISDDSGRRKVQIDWNDREKLKKQISAAYGMRKFQVERDRAQAELKKLEPEYKDLKSGWDSLENAFKSSGIPGVVNLLMNKSDGYEQQMAQEYQRRRAREDASPDEIAKLDLQDRAERAEAERQRMQKQMEEHLSSVSREREAADESKAMSIMTPAFEKYRFTGKLGSSEAERGLDKLIWNEAIEVLSSLPETQEVTPAMAEAKFREISSKYKSVFNNQVEQKTKQVIQRKKMDAQERASINAVKSPSKQSDAMNKVDAGNIGGGILDFFKNGWKA